MALDIPEFDGTNGMDVARARIAWEAEHRTGALDLTGLDLEELPVEIAAFSHLRELRLGDAPDSYEKIEDGFKNNIDINLILMNVNLETLYIKNSTISNFSFLKSFPNLLSLECPYSDIQNLQGLKYTPNLHTLNCSGTQISSLAGLEGCASLHTLFCYNTQISSLAGLEGCTSLHALDCSGTEIRSLAELKDCTNLHTLLCFESKISSLAGLENCTNLHTLDCSCNKISSLEELKGCTNLHTLYCFGTEISSLRGLEGCTSLHELECCSTKISNLAELKDCKNIQYLDFSDTNMSDFRELKQLINLRHLNCSNVFTIFSENTLEDIVNLSLERLFLYSYKKINNFDMALLSSGYDDSCLPALRAHFADLRQEALEQRDFKILVLGNGCSGKTQLVRRLCEDEFADTWDSTHGIQLAQAHVPDRDDHTLNRLTIWDFGGQELYHGTHALFLRHASAVIINWAVDTEQESERIDPHGLQFRNHPVGYWLTLLETLAPTEMPRLLVQSKSDRPAKLIPVLPDGHQEIPQIRFSAKTKQGLGQLKGGLQDAIATHRQHHRYKIGAGRQRMIDRLLAMAEQGFDADHKLINRATFDDWCQEVGQISDPEQFLIYLDRSGLLIHRPRHLGDRIILDQSWALNALYTLFQRQTCYQKLIKDGGRFTAQRLNDLVWRQDYSDGEQELFLNLMQASGICFRVGNEDDNQPLYLAPDLLPERNAVEAEVKARWVGGGPEVSQTVRYRFRHPGILRSLIGYIGRRTKLHALYWRTGLCAYDDSRNSRLLIDEIPNPEGWGCELELKAKDGAAEELLAWTVVVLEMIHQDLGVQPETPLPVQPMTKDLAPPVGSSRDYDWYVSYPWGDKSPEGKKRTRIINKLMEAAQVQNISILRDNNEISFGDSIRAFMEKLAAGQRIFILLSDKYLKSPSCTYELYHIWRQCRQDAGEFSARVRLFKAPCAQIGDPGQRAAYYRHWKTEAARLSDIIAAYDPADVPKLDQDMLRAINGFKGQIGDILAEISNRVQPRKWEDFIQHGFT